MATSEQREQLGYELSALANSAIHHLTAEQVDQLKLKVSRAFADLEQQLTRERDKLDQSEGTIASLRISLWETLHQLEEARALLVKFTAEDAEPILSDVNGYLCLLCETQVDDYEIGHFPHALDCACTQARVFLLKKEASD